MPVPKKIAPVLLFFLCLTTASFGAEPGWRTLHGHVPAVVTRLASKGRLPATNELSLAIGLPLRNQNQLDELIAQLYDPHSTNYHKYLTPAEFTAQFGPTTNDYQAVIQFAETNGFTVIGRHSNRVVLDVTGRASNVERAFRVILRTYRHPTEPRDFFAPDVEPSVPANLPVADVSGLSDFSQPHPLSHPTASLLVQSLSGSGPNGWLRGSDFRNAYVPGTPLTGAGQAVGLLQFDGYTKSDITNYENQVGMTNYVPLTNVLVNHFSGNAGGNNDEVCLDIEMAIAMAPGLSRVIVYEAQNKTANATTILNRMATDNLAKQLSSSWFWNTGPSVTIDNIFKNMAAQGQSFFEASGDSDAYTGDEVLGTSQSVAPMDSPFLTSVGGTTLYMNGTGASWSSETVWNYNIYGGLYANIGTGGGISTYYPIPDWQTNVSMAANQSSTANRNIPDVALTADQIYITYGSGTNGGRAGTSCAAPLWAGFCALLNQQSAASDGATVGFLNPALYAVGAGSNYTACFNDITTGSNIGTNTPGLFSATSGYDLCTGLGTPNGTNLINTLAPLVRPFFITQPFSQNAANGANLIFNLTAIGQPPLNYQWLLNGTNLSAGGNVSDSTSNVLSIAAATTNNSGDYSLVVTNSYGAITSSVAIVNIGFAPVLSAPPTNLTILSGGTAIFSAMVDGSSPLTCHWHKNGTTVSNGAGISGATSNVLTLTGVTTGSSGNYNLSVTNIFGVTTSSVAILTVVLPPAITSSSLTNRILQCGGNNVTFAFTVTGTPPLNYQWSLDGTPVANATNTSFSVTNLHLPDHSIGVAVTNLYSGLTSNAALAVQDTIAPAITLNGGNPIFVELGSAFTDPGATATDICAGAVGVTVNGLVNTNSVSTNTLIYTAGDGDGNTSTLARTIIVHDTTPPTILWSFTNLVLAADTNCSAPMPDVTGTNYILATDLSGALTNSQSPTNGAVLVLGTNAIVITIQDASGNAACSTNQIIVQDQTSPVILDQPQSATNDAGGTANFSVTATACTPLAFQWFFNNAPVAGQTNSSFAVTNISPDSAGNYFAVASASGGSTTSSVATLAMNLFSTSIELATSENPSGFQDNLNFTAAVTPANATGLIQFFTNGAVFDSEMLVAGQAVSTNLNLLQRGTNCITAIYSGDANDLPSTNLLLQIVTNHPPVAAPAFYTNVIGTRLVIVIACLATNWSDADGDTVSLAGVSVSTNGVAIKNTGTKLVYSSCTNVADQFTCTITDGWGGTNFQTIFIAAAPVPDTTPGNLGVAAVGDGFVTLNLGGATGSTYVLETTTNLFPPGDWLPVATNTLDTNGIWQFTDTQITNFPQRFYRLKLAP